MQGHQPDLENGSKVSTLDIFEFVLLVSTVRAFGLQDRDDMRSARLLLAI